MRKARARVPRVNRSRHARTCSEDATSLGVNSYQKNNTSLDSFLNSPHKTKHLWEEKEGYMWLCHKLTHPDGHMNDYFSGYILL
jgi:hypothetical protein